VASGHIIINNKRRQASRVALCFSFDQNMPRAPHVAPVLGPQRDFFGAPEQITGRQQNPRGAKQALDLAAAVAERVQAAGAWTGVWEVIRSPLTGPANGLLCFATAGCSFFLIRCTNGLVQEGRGAPFSVAGRRWD
jgi:hypothetical protein